MRRWYPLIIVLVLLAGSSLIVLINNRSPMHMQQDHAVITPTVGVSPTPADFKAHFAIFTRGTFRVFTDSRYHNVSEIVFIESSFPNTINVKRGSITWGDFFETLPMSLEKECLTTGTGQRFCTNAQEKLAFYINGVEDKDALDKKINPQDRLLVSYGPNSKTAIQTQLKRLEDIK